MAPHASRGIHAGPCITISRGVREDSGASSARDSLRGTFASRARLYGVLVRQGCSSPLLTATADAAAIEISLIDVTIAARFIAVAMNLHHPWGRLANRAAVAALAAFLDPR
ncbi:hypothetical protein D9M71_61510 [compost metagenome]